MRDFETDNAISLALQLHDAQDRIAELEAEVERLRAELEWAAESFDELGAHGSARLTRLRVQPLAPAEVQSTDLGKSTELIHRAEEVQL